MALARMVQEKMTKRRMKSDGASGRDVEGAKPDKRRRQRGLGASKGIGDGRVGIVMDMEFGGGAGVSRRCKRIDSQVDW